jgi:hypothetical protein
MKIAFSPYQSNDIPAVKRFNQRLRDTNSNFSFSESNVSSAFPKDGQAKLYNEYFLAKDENGEVRGAYYFQNEEYYINGQYTEIGFWSYPLSEGVINKRYTHVGASMVRDLEQRRKLVFVLGMRGFQYLLPKMLKINGWYMYLVPFYFFIVDVRSFFNEFEYLNTLRKSFIKKIILDIVRFSGLLNIFTFLIKIYSTVYRFLSFRKYSGVNVENVDEFSSFADELWEKNKDCYSVLAKRDSDFLNKIYPKTVPQFRKLKITKKGICIGWVILLCAKMKDDKYFGNLTVGTLVDAFSNPADAELLIYKSLEYLRELNADLIIANHANVKWGRYFVKNGFIKGPSNFIFACSKGIKEFYPSDIDFGNSFIMRGDGEGPTHFL